MKAIRREFRESKEHFARRSHIVWLKARAEEITRGLEVENLPKEVRDDLVYQLVLINEELASM